VKREEVWNSQGRKGHPKYNKPKEDELDWLHLSYELPPKTR